MTSLTSNQLLAQATAAHRSGRFKEAVDGYERVLRVSRNNATVFDMLGSAQNSLGLTAEGRRNIEKAIRLSPNTAQFHHDLSLTYRRDGNFPQAHACLDKAIKLDPKNTSFVAAKAELHFMAGEMAKAMEVLEPALTVTPLPPAVPVMFGTIAPRVKRQREAAEMLEALLARPDVPAVRRMKAYFVLGAVYDSMDEFDKAFEAYRRGNELNPMKFDGVQHRERTSKAIAAWTREAIEALPASRIDGSRMIFVLGMPRSGTTLVEQIVAAAPGIHAAGELNTMLRIARSLDGGDRTGMPILTSPAALNQKNVNDAGIHYLDPIKRMRVGDARVIDKMPANFLNLGLIQAALPGAKVIHCMRDPADTCLSCYFQLFDGNLSFAYDLARAGAFYREYERLMAHWKQVLSIPILDVQYESLVADQEGVSRTLYDFLGIPWTDEAMRFHESSRIALTSSNAQVRQPVYTRSVLRHKHYEKHLGPLYEALAVKSA